MKRGIAGLYAVTPDVAGVPELVAMAEAALTGGARQLQYRNKSATSELRLAQARALLALCRRMKVPLIVNDHLELALAVGADGLHLGAEDGSLATARERLGSARILGASCYDRLELALEAQRLGADYVAFGSFFSSGVKPGAVRAPLTLLRDAKRRLSVPVVAIGGISLKNARQLIAAGADSIAVISALFGADDSTDAARRFSELFKQHELAARH
ncbi:MAG TPA: thiamine phosphate synthase [Burkholderiales bacterium]|nr:thiamine phosphate synthase [Burkholderiales bacterium]